ncbi:hypothetical protein [Neorhodopirellula pilleata]|uniref:hypothetical protein n=1 Tax=Neorhodopirellula pilleata TaxID=2714738 RepID=UPI0011B47787|nr:hypothetical protein [Neorhodopirellula pilleata]
MNPTGVDAGDRTPESATRFVLLRNDHVLRGEVTTHGSSVVIRRGSGSELTLRNDQVFAIRDDLQSLFDVRQSMKRRRWQSSVSELLDDARWCVDQQMPDQATKLLLQIYQLAPDHPVAAQLESRLRRTIQTNEATDSTTHVRKASFDRQADQESGRSDEFGLAHLNGTTAPQELHSFTSRIQPILISRCGQCHDEKSSRSWQLKMPHPGSRVGQSGTVENLKSTLRYCRPGDGDGSELLRMATTAHDDNTDKPPIAQYESQLIATLNDWISRLSTQERTVDASLSNELLKETSALAPAVEGMGSASELIRAEPGEVEASLAPPPQADISRGNLPQPVRLPVVSDPDDARHFNRETKIRRLFGFD